MSLSKIIILAGGICSGKSYVASIIREEGFRIIDCDNIAKNLMEIDGIAYASIAREFSEVIDKSGNIDKKKLSNIIFNDEYRRCCIEEIIHPLVKEYIIKEANKNEIIFVETAIAKRSKFYLLGDVWFVYAPYKDRLSRMVNQRKVEVNHAINIINLQKEEDELIDVAKLVINNSDGVDPKEYIIEALDRLRNETM